MSVGKIVPCSKLPEINHLLHNLLQFNLYICVSIQYIEDHKDKKVHHTAILKSTWLELWSNYKHLLILWMTKVVTTWKFPKTSGCMQLKSFNTKQIYTPKSESLKYTFLLYYYHTQHHNFLLLTHWAFFFNNGVLFIWKKQPGHRGCRHVCQGFFCVNGMHREQEVGSRAPRDNLSAPWSCEVPFTNQNQNIFLS